MLESEPVGRNAISKSVQHQVLKISNANRYGIPSVEVQLGILNLVIARAASLVHARVISHDLPAIAIIIIRRRAFVITCVAFTLGRRQPRNKRIGWFRLEPGPFGPRRSPHAEVY